MIITMSMETTASHILVWWVWKWIRV